MFTVYTKRSRASFQLVFIHGQVLLTDQEKKPDTVEKPVISSKLTDLWNLDWNNLLLSYLDHKFLELKNILCEILS